MGWEPKRTLAECDDILCAPGMPHEMETRLVDGRVQRVYKNLWPTLRSFWLWAACEYSDKTYIVFGDERVTYHDIFHRSLRAAGMFRGRYGICKGDRVGICARNLPDYLVAFWACHILGAVSVLVNAWLPAEPLVHCVSHTGCKLLLLDSERADRIVPAVSSSKWESMELWESVMRASASSGDDLLVAGPDILPEDNALVIFTSGTTGLPKGVLSTQRQFLTNLRNATAAAARAALRRGDDVPAPPPGPQRGLLVSVPFFHVTGLTSLSMLATSAGMKIVLVRKWDPAEAARLIRAENVRIAGGVPSMVADLVDRAGLQLDTLLFGGAAAPQVLPARAKVVFPHTVLSQAYGMTETNSIAVGIAGEDYVARPTSVGLPCPVNDALVMRNDAAVRPGEIGEIWLRGPDIMKGYWGDEVATAKTITADGWIRTGDLGCADEEGFLYVHDRIKDMIIRGGENIASVMVEDALYHDERIAEVAAVGVPDEKLGELVAVIVSTKPAFHGLVREAELFALAREKLPYFAVPVMILIQDTPFELTPSAKIIKAPLRKLAAQEWERRKAEARAAARL
ncbi:acyl--CoA ligase [Phanerochaete sordida]|uniref:Acyl--CoA ligase n=1 Tax=Phanerochaete sordida TaxID=48140 RepID=A0A9P3L755_9APHY|nr:acyl--CoA ligase [Phanerochaete sordida]